jgi:hypothetical protein
MTKGTRIAGGIITIISGAFTLFLAIFDNSSIFTIYWIPEWFAGSAFTLITGGLSIAGGILLCVDKNYGAILVLISASYYFLIGYIMWAYIWMGNIMMSVGPLLNWPFHFFMLVGGILGLASGSEK